MANTQQNSSSKEFLGTEPLGRLMVRLALPSVASQLVNILYTIIDRIFIGHIPGVGADALTGVGVCLPIIMLISSFAAFTGAGGAPLASIALGSGNKRQANIILRNSMILLGIFAILLMALFYVFKEDLLLLFGASPHTLPYGVSYLSMYLLGTFFVMAYLGLTPFLLAQGDSRFTLVAITTGAVLHIVLDVVFIFGMDMGIVGAGLASVVSQGVSALLTCVFLFRKNSAFTFERRWINPQLSLMGSILALGSAPFAMQATESLIVIVLNGTLQAYGGDVYVGTFTVLQSVFQLIFAPSNGFNQGVQPIVSYNYGAGNIPRVKQTIKRMIATTFSVVCVCTLLVIYFRGAVAQLFTEDPELVSLVVKTAPYFYLGIIVFGIQMAIQSSFVGLGQSKFSITVALMRKIVLLIPLALIFPHFFGVTGVYIAEPVSDITSVLFCTTLFALNIKRILKTPPPAATQTKQ